jgi:predicted metal-binding membrane protein
MAGMDAGPGTDLGALGWFVGVWVTMMAAMMLPSALPMIVLYSRTARGRPLDTIGFVCGYLAIWTLYGLAAYGTYQLLGATVGGILAWHRSGPLVAGAAIAASGLYQLTPLKARCLRHCRSPLHFILQRWRKGPLGAVRMGAGHGAYCVGCCWGLMLALFALGVMSIFWMALIAAVIFVEKLLPGGERVSRALALGLVAVGIWVAAAPASVPHLTQPGSAQMQPMG